ncbi:MAG: sugar transferase [Coriobacteriales bacterium]
MLYAIIAIAIKIDDPKGPIVFKQERIGKDGKPFTMYKFRSICVNAEEKLADLKELNEKTGPVFKIAEDSRITRVGKVIRKLSFDELPQFANMLRGNISLIGPRVITRDEVGDRMLTDHGSSVETAQRRQRVDWLHESIASARATRRRTSRVSAPGLRAGYADFGLPETSR